MLNQQGMFILRQMASVWANLHSHSQEGNGTPTPFKVQTQQNHAYKKTQKYSMKVGKSWDSWNSRDYLS